MGRNRASKKGHAEQAAPHEEPRAEEPQEEEVAPQAAPPAVAEEDVHSPPRAASEEQAAEAAPQAEEAAATAADEQTYNPDAAQLDSTAAPRDEEDEQQEEDEGGAQEGQFVVEEEEEGEEAEPLRMPPAAKEDDISTIPTTTASDNDERQDGAAVALPPIVADAVCDARLAKNGTALSKVIAAVCIVRAVAIAIVVWALIFVLEALQAAEARYPKHVARARTAASDVYAKARAAIGCGAEERTIDRLRALVPFARPVEAKAAALDARFANGAVSREVTRVIADGVTEFNKSCPAELLPTQ